MVLPNYQLVNDKFPLSEMPTVAHTAIPTATYRLLQDIELLLAAAAATDDASDDDDSGPPPLVDAQADEESDDSMPELIGATQNMSLRAARACAQMTEAEVTRGLSATPLTRAFAAMTAGPAAACGCKRKGQCEATAQEVRALRARVEVLEATAERTRVAAAKAVTAMDAAAAQPPHPPQITVPRLDAEGEDFWMLNK